MSTVPMVITLDHESSAPLHRQIYQALRASILEQRLRPGTRLPATRVLAVDLSVSRTTVLCAYNRLAAEGFVTTSGGGGTRVASCLAFDTPDVLRQPVTAEEQSRRCIPLAIGYPALDEFPVATWARLTAQRWRQGARAMLLLDDGRGFGPLREAIAQYITMARAVRCTAEQVIVTAGAQQAIDLTARVVVRSGDSVWMEGPGSAPARATFAAVGAEVIAVPVDDQGLCVSAGRAAAPAARLAFVTPRLPFKGRSER